MLTQYREYDTDSDKVKVYEHRLRQGEAALERDRSVIEDWWRRYEQGRKANQTSQKGHRISSPLATSIIDSQYSSMTAADVDIIVEALGAGTSDQEYLASAALSKEWERTKANNRTSASVKDALIGGLGWAKVDYEYYDEEQELPRADEDIAADIDAMFRQAEEAGESAPTADDIIRFVPVTAPTKVVLAQRITVDHLPWDSVIFDPTAKRMVDIRWYAQRTLLPIEEVTQNPVFRAYCKDRGTLRQLDKLQADSQIDETVLGESGVQQDDKRITVYEIVDLETGTRCWMAKGTKFLLAESANPFAINDDPEDQTPFVPLVLRGTNRRVRGVSEMEVLESTLDELDLYHSRLATFLERYAPKLVGEEGSVTEAGKKALTSQDVGAVVEYKTGKNPPVPMGVPQVPSEVFAMPQRLEDGAKEATGSNELMRGMFPDRKRTATETAEVVTASQARQAEKRLALERFYTAIARRMLQLMQMFYTEEQMVRYWDSAGPIEWSWTADDIVFENQLRVVLTPRETPNRQARRDEALELLNVFGPLTQQPDPATGAPVVDQTGLLQVVADKMGLKRREVAMFLRGPAEQQIRAQMAAQAQAAQASAAGGLPRPDMQPGPMDAQALAAAANAGTIPPEVLLAAQGTTPVSPGAVEQVSENGGVK